MEWLGLQEQKRNAAEQMDLATASRKDAYGNEEKYNPYLHTWENLSTPQTKAILAAQQAEQEQSLTHDMPQARKLRDAQFARGEEAGREYETLLSQYRNNPPKSEGAYADEFTNDALFAMQDRARKAGSDLSTLAVRSGRDPKSLSSIVDAVANQEAAGMGDATIAGKQAGQLAHQGAEQAYRQKLDPLKLFAGLQDDLGGFTPERSTAGQDIMGMQRDMETAISQALSNRSNMLGGAYGRLANSLGQSPDLSGIANALSKFTLDGSGSSFSAPIVGSGGTGGVPIAGVGSGATGLGINGGSNIWDPYGSGGSVKDRIGTGGNKNEFDFLDPKLGMNFSWP
jgi:hypothetical protein